MTIPHNILKTGIFVRHIVHWKFYGQDNWQWRSRGWGRSPYSWGLLEPGIMQFSGKTFLLRTCPSLTNNLWVLFSSLGRSPKPKTCQKNHDNNITMGDIIAEIPYVLCVFWDWWSLFDSWLKLTPINLLPFSLVGARYSFCHYNREIYNSNQIGICLACLDTPCFLPHFSVHFPPCFIDSGLQISCYTIFITYIMLNNILFN